MTAAERLGSALAPTSTRRPWHRWEVVTDVVDLAAPTVDTLGVFAVTMRHYFVFRRRAAAWAHLMEHPPPGIVSTFVAHVEALP